jgi:hypothetical protein
MTTLTQADIDAKVQRLFNLCMKLKGSNGVGPDVPQYEREAVALGMELGSIVIGAFVRMAEAQERIASMLEDEFGPAHKTLVK